jgi:hypothetical protein
MAPQLDPGQRLFAAWLAHRLRAQLHAIDAHAADLAGGPLTAAQRAHVTALRVTVRELVSEVDALVAAPP